MSQSPSVQVDAAGGAEVRDVRRDDGQEAVRIDLDDVAIVAARGGRSRRSARRDSDSSPSRRASRRSPSSSPAFTNTVYCFDLRLAVPRVEAIERGFARIERAVHQRILLAEVVAIAPRELLLLVLAGEGEEARWRRAAGLSTRRSVVVPPSRATALDVRRRGPRGAGRRRRHVRRFVARCRTGHRCT